MVCAAWVGAVLTACGVLEHINWTQLTPQNLVEMKLYKDYVVLYGNPKLVRFNTL
jgi:hypothetical protein